MAETAWLLASRVHVGGNVYIESGCLGVYSTEAKARQAMHKFVEANPAKVAEVVYKPVQVDVDWWRSPDYLRYLRVTPPHPTAPYHHLPQPTPTYYAPPQPTPTYHAPPQPTATYHHPPHPSTTYHPQPTAPYHAFFPQST